MAEDSISWAVNQFKCTVCLHLLSDPVIIPCGHSYCMNCIKGCWDQEDQTRVYRCPQCKETFTSRPVLNKNVIAAEMVEKLKIKKRKPKPSVAAHCNAGPGEAQSVPLQHDMMDYTRRPQQPMCPRHGEPLDFYCNWDAQSICKQCVVAEYRFHCTVSLATARSDKQRQLEKTQRQLKQRIKEIEEGLQKQIDAVESHKLSAEAAVEDTERLFAELISSIEKSRHEVIQLIRDQEKTAVSQGEELLAKLLQENDDLEKRYAEIQQLSQIENHNHFLRGFQNFPLTETTDLLNLSSSDSLLSLNDNIDGSVSRLRESVQQFCRYQIESVSDEVKYLQEMFNPKHEAWRKSPQLSSPLLTSSFDSGTVGSRLHSVRRSNFSAPSPSMRKRCSWSPRSYPDFPDNP